MAAPSPDPYKTLGVSAGASDAEIRAAYRRLVQLHHPDHNNGSAEAARRFEEVQDAYARIRDLRAKAGLRGPTASQARPSRQPPPKAKVDPDVEARLADIERELREAQQARERAQRAAREARQARERAARAAREAAGEAAGDATGQSARRPSDEELGYIRTDDSFTKIFSDALSGLSDRVSEASKTSIGERVGDLIEELDELASKLTAKRPPHSPE